MKKLYFVFLLLSGHSGIFSQTNFNYGFKIGLALDFGTHVNRLGVTISSYQNISYFSTNSYLTFYYNFQSYAIKQKGYEIQTGISAGGVFGQRDTNQFIRFGVGENNTGYQNSIAYSYLYYFDNQKTSQANGQFIFEFSDWRFLMANDLFGGGKGWRDRYRTGAFKIDYSHEAMRFGITTLFWTGDFVGCEIKKDSTYPNAAFGYRTLSGSQYGNISMGVLSADFSYVFPHGYFNHSAHLSLGVDSEKLRHVMQNRFIHDQPFLPHKLKKDVPHIPMISCDDQLYLFQDDQCIKPLDFYFKVGLSSPDFY